MDLTEKQEKIYRFIQTYRANHGFPPSQREIAAELDIGKTTVREHLAALEKKGYITRKNSRGMIETPAQMGGVYK